MQVHGDLFLLLKRLRGEPQRGLVSSRRIDGLLDYAEEAMDRLDWGTVRECARVVLYLAQSIAMPGLSGSGRATVTCKDNVAVLGVAF